MNKKIFLFLYIISKMVVGKELIVDIQDIYDISKLETIDGIKPLLEQIIKELNLNVVGYCEKQFEPYGATVMYLLSESHLCVHTYPEYSSLSLNLYTCNKNTNLDEAIKIINKYFEEPYYYGNIYITKNILKR